ncbi:MAG TPA: bifunctional hydroxymethylpyrimidine kinase/phosphomethylpyrimidine kinase [Gemmatimonadaceae bacterium]|nr:bifunctional hydroxymethylpyrimidine kinase/phosphomethylpyrimidine kinase [Gemmatimonadaceae bacterium]
MFIALTIAGSDSGGGAGIQADLKTFHQLGVYGTSVITAITAQNTVGVTQWEAVSAEMVRAQLDAVVTDLRPRAFKTGMLANAGIVREIASAAREHDLAGYVLDPVMVATSGDVLIERDAVAAIREQLLPMCALVTPNAHEAALLTGLDVESESDLARAAEVLVRELGAGAALVKGGHINTGQDMVDVLFDGSAVAFRNSRVETTSTHGTGCTLSAAVAAELAKGSDLRTACARAVDFVHRAIEAAPGLGAGHGPLNHFVR